MANVPLNEIATDTGGNLTALKKSCKIVVDPATNNVSLVIEINLDPGNLLFPNDLLSENTILCGTGPTLPAAKQLAKSAVPDIAFTTKGSDIYLNLQVKVVISIVSSVINMLKNCYQFSRAYRKQKASIIDQS